MKTFKHSGDMGDTIYSLPVIKHHGGASCLYLNPDGLKAPKYDGSRSGFDKETIDFITPLLESQSYIKKVKSWKNERVETDLDLFRRAKIRYHTVNLCEEILKVFNVPFSETDKPWIEVPIIKKSPVIFCRSPRYQNKKIDLKKYLHPDSLFIGLEEEWRQFCQEVGKIRFYKVKDALEMASIIAGADIFIGNQSFGMSLAIAMHQRYIQEVYPRCQNCIFKRRNAIYLVNNAEDGFKISFPEVARKRRSQFGAIGRNRSSRIGGKR